jgi:hypothetical protein
MKSEKGENWAIKQIVIFQNNLKDRLERLIKEERKDDLLDFEQLGVDRLFIDEAHNYKDICYRGSFGNDTLLYSATARFAVHSEDCAGIGKGEENKIGQHFHNRCPILFL